MMYPIFLCMVAGTVLGASLAVATEQITPAPLPAAPLKPAPSFKQIFTEADKDADGALSKDEARSARLGRLVEYFIDLDSDSDGALSLAEIWPILRRRLSS